MSCEITAGRGLPCKDNQGGIAAIYIFNTLEPAAYTLDANGSITAISGNAFEWKIATDAGSLTQNITADPVAGTTFFEQVLDFNLIGISVTDFAEVQSLLWSRPKIVVKTRNGEYFLVGRLNGMEATGGAITSGAASGDQVGFQITMTGKERTMANIVTTFPDTVVVTSGTDNT